MTTRHRPDGARPPPGGPAVLDQRAMFWILSQAPEEQRQGPAHAQLQWLIRQQHEQEIANPARDEAGGNSHCSGYDRGSNQAAAPASDERMTSATAVRTFCAVSYQTSGRCLGSCEGDHYGCEDAGRAIPNNPKGPASSRTEAMRTMYCVSSQQTVEHPSPRTEAGIHDVERNLTGKADRQQDDQGEVPTQAGPSTRSTRAGRDPDDQAVAGAAGNRPMKCALHCCLETRGILTSGAHTGGTRSRRWIRSPSVLGFGQPVSQRESVPTRAHSGSWQ